MTTVTFSPTKQQVEVTRFFKDTFNSTGKLNPVAVFLNAVAGSGKTSTIMLQVEALIGIEKELGRSVQACSVSFNTNIRDASQVKLTNMGSTVQAKTTNQLGRSILAAAAKDGLCRAPQQMADVKKYDLIANDYMKPFANDPQHFPNMKTRFKDFRKAVTAVKTLVTAVRNTRTGTTEDNLLDLVYHYDLQEQIDVTAPYWPLVSEKIGLVIDAGVTAYNNGYFSAVTKENKKPGWHDFDDQICLPLQLDLAAPIWDVIFIDEAQDLNRARLEMMTRVVKAHGVLFFVGDPDQAIQGFTFADTDSVQTIQTVTKSVEFPLSVCWRCDTNIIRMAQAIVPRIEARPGAHKGIVDVVSEGNFINMLETGYKRGNEEKDPDLVLCRVKAPLVAPIVGCLEAIRAGKAAIVRGRDIGRGIVSLLEDILSDRPVEDFEILRDQINEYTAKKIEKLGRKKDAEAKIAELLDRSDTILALLDGYLYSINNNTSMASVEALKLFISEKFADDETAEEAKRDRVKPIVFSTIHKAKGLEYDRVFILEPSKLPHPAAKIGWQSQQERNIIYVAVTRAKHALYFVGGVPAPLQDIYYEIKAEEEAELNTVAAIAEAEMIIASPAPVELEAAPVAEASDDQPSPVQAVAEKRTGRKAVDAADKDQKIEACVDPSIKAAFLQFVAKLQSLDVEEIREMLPNQETAIGHSDKIVTKKVSGADVIEAALLSFEPFKAFLQTEAKEHQEAYEDRRERQEQARQIYKSRKKKANAPAPVETDDQGPDDDGNGGGQPVEAAPPCENEQEETEQDAPAIATPESTTWGTNSLFPEVAEESTRQIRRVFYHCPRCKKNWYADYYVAGDGRMYRVNEDGEVIYAQDDFAQCPGCSNDRRWLRKTVMRGSYSAKRKCDSRCYNAHPGSDCTCSCGGSNHGTGKAHHVERIGRPLLQMVAIKE